MLLITSHVGWIHEHSPDKLKTIKTIPCCSCVGSLLLLFFVGTYFVPWGLDQELTGGFPLQLAAVPWLSARLPYLVTEWPDAAVSWGIVPQIDVTLAPLLPLSTHEWDPSWIILIHSWKPLSGALGRDLVFDEAVGEKEKRWGKARKTGKEDPLAEQPGPNESLILQRQWVGHVKNDWFLFCSINFWWDLKGGSHRSHQQGHISGLRQQELDHLDWTMYKKCAPLCLKLWPAPTCNMLVTP